MKRLLSIVLLLAIAISCLASCDNGNGGNGANGGENGDEWIDPAKLSSAVIIKTSDGSAELLKSKIEAKTGETIDIVSVSNKADKTAIYISKNASSFDAYGWDAEAGKITLFHSVLTDANALFDAFVANITSLASINSVQSASFVTSAENNIYDATDAMFAVIDARSEAIKNSVMTAASFDASKATGTVYYVSNNGNDSANGKSPETAWKTLAKVESTALSSGDVVLLERGSVFRETINAAKGVTYSSYGEGEKPVIMNSKKNYAGLWEIHDAEHNIWKLKETVVDPGIVVFNADPYTVGSNQEITATRLFNKKGETESPYNQLLTTELDLVYYWGTPTTLYTNLDQNSKGYTLYLRSETDPNTYSSVEIGEDGPMFSVKADNVVIDGLAFKYGGGHAVAGRGCKNLTVRNSVFAWLGGSLLNGSSADNKGTRYGNAIEMFSGVDGYYVYNNWIYEIFDTGITFQYHYSSGTQKMVNIEIFENLVEKCYWSLEWWISPNSGAEKNPEVANVYVHDNILREGFNSWGTLHHNDPRYGAMLSSAFGTKNLYNFVLENNIFDRTYHAEDPELQTRMLNISIGNGNANIEYKGNLFLQYKNQILAKVSYSDKENSFNATRSKIKSFMNLLKNEASMDMTSNFYCIVESNK